MVSHSKKVYKPRQDAFYVSHNLTSVYHHLHSNPPLQRRSEPAPSTRLPLLHGQGFSIRHLHTGFARCGLRRAAQGNGTKILTRLTGSWLTSLPMNHQDNYVVSFSVYIGCGVEVEVPQGGCGAGETQRLCRDQRGGRLISRSSGGVRLARGGLLRGSWDGTDTVNQGGSR
jgi:hypothetical protein